MHLMVGLCMGARISTWITESQEVRKILRHLVKVGRSPPKLEQSSV
jgi:hypothetical protein